jgi:hypothetical protein
LNFESKTHEAQLEDQKPTKSSRRSSRRRKNHNTLKRHKKWQTKQNSKEELRKKIKIWTQTQNSQTPPEINSPLTLAMQALPLDRYYYVPSLNHLISKSSTIFVHSLSLWQ